MTEIRKLIEEMKKRIQKEVFGDISLANTAPIFLQKLTYRLGEKGQVETVSFPFGDQNDFLKHITGGKSITPKGRYVVLGESGLGKSWLLARTYMALAELTDLNPIIPFFVRLKNQSLMRSALSKRELGELSKLSPETQRKVMEMDKLQQYIEKPEQVLEEIVFGGGNFSKESLKDFQVVLILDGLNEIPREGRKNLIDALEKAFANADWIISTQPQILDDVEWLKNKQPLYDKNGRPVNRDPWEFFQVRPVTDELVGEYLRIHLGEGPYRELKEPLSERLKTVDISIRRNPRYLSVICFHARHRGIGEIPTEGGKLLDLMVSTMLQKIGAADEADSELVRAQKVILGALGIYEVLSEGEALYWEHEILTAGRSVLEWLKPFADSHVLTSTWESHLHALRARGPWGFGPPGIVAFDHDTTRDFAVAYFIRHLLENWTPWGRHEGFREWMVIELAINPKFSKPVQMVVELLENRETLRLPEMPVKLVDSGDYLSPFFPETRKELLQRLEDVEAARSAIQLLTPVVTTPEVRDAFLAKLGDTDWVFVDYEASKDIPSAIGEEVGEALASAVDDREVRNALLERLEVTSPFCREAAVKALAPALYDSIVRRALVKMLDDHDNRVRFAAIKILSPAVNDPAVRDALLKMLDDEDREIRRVAAVTLTSAVGVLRVRDILRSRMTDQDGWVRYAAYKALTGDANSHIVTGNLLKGLLADGDCWDQSALELASKALTLEVKDQAVRDLVMASLKDEDYRVRFVATAALSSVISDDGVRSALLVMLQDETELVRRAAVEALAAGIDDSSVRDHLIKALGDGSRDVRSAAAKVLVPAADDSKVRAAFLSKLGDQVISEAAIKLLAAAAGDVHVRNALLAKLKYSGRAVREAAIEALAPAVDAPAVKSAILGMLRGKNSGVCEAAVKALAPAVDDSSVQDALLEIVGDEKNQVRGAALTALAPVAIKQKVRNSILRAVSNTVTSFEDNVPKTIFQWLSLNRLLDSGIEALIPLRTEPDVKKRLMGFLESKSGHVRGAGARALTSAINDATVKAALTKMLTDEDEEVREIAVKSFSFTPPINELYLRPGRFLNASNHSKAVAAQNRSPLLLTCLVFYLSPETFLSVLGTVCRIRQCQDVYGFLNSGIGPRHLARRTEKSDLIASLKKLFPPNDKGSSSALCYDGRPVFFNYATFGLGYLLRDVERYALTHESRIQRGIHVIFEGDLIPTMGFNAGSVAELCHEDELLCDDETAMEKTIVAPWEAYRNHLSNLIANSRIHKNKTCKVILTSPLDGSAKDPIVLVLDDGNGFPADVKEIAELFKRGSTRTPGGSGNGLTMEMVREFWEMGFRLNIKDREGSWYEWVQHPKTGEFVLKETEIPNAIRGMNDRLLELSGGTGAIVGIMQ